MSGPLTQHQGFIGCTWLIGSVTMITGLGMLLGAGGSIFGMGLAVLLASVIEAIDPSPEDDDSPAMTTPQSREDSR